MATTTFLFTDIKGSTRLWDADGDAMPDGSTFWCWEDPRFRFQLIELCDVLDELLRDGVGEYHVPDAICHAFWTVGNTTCTGNTVADVYT